MKKRKNAFIIMSSAYLPISILKQSIIPEMPLKIFISNLSRRALLEYTSNAGIYYSNKNISKNILVDLIVDEHDTTEKEYTEKDNNSTISDINNLISSNRDFIIART